MLFATATIGALFKFGDLGDWLGWVTKVDEGLLIAASFLCQRQSA